MADAVCAGHICLDLTPRFPQSGKDLADILVPGRLIAMGDMTVSAGGSVANTGGALAKLGLCVHLRGKLADDEMGRLTVQALKDMGIPTQGLFFSKEGTSPYSVVLAVPGYDRIFLHHSGMNSTFGACDIDYDEVRRARLFHFGYPQLMRGTYLEDGSELAAILAKAKETGVTTSLDFAMPDMGTDAKDVDWEKLLARVLPHTDIFLPSIEELLLTAEPALHSQLAQKSEDILSVLDPAILPDLAERFLSMGAAVVGFKCGTRGYYVRTADAARIAAMGRGAPDPFGWAARQVFSGIYTVPQVVSATGAGDTSIAGFLAGLLSGYSLADSVNAACAAGALCVGTAGAIAGIVPLEDMMDKVRAGWRKVPSQPPHAGFAFLPASDLYVAE